MLPFLCNLGRPKLRRWNGSRSPGLAKVDHQSLKPLRSHPGHQRPTPVGLWPAWVPSGDKQVEIQPSSSHHAGLLPGGGFRGRLSLQPPPLLWGLSTLGCPAQALPSPEAHLQTQGDAWALQGSGKRGREAWITHNLSALRKYTSPFQKIESNGMEIWLSDYGYCSVDVLPGVSSRREINLYFSAFILGLRF